MTATRPTFKCKQPGCDETVEYRKIEVLGLTAMNHSSASPEKVVYLTCGRGHTFPYLVPKEPSEQQGGS